MKNKGCKHKYHFVKESYFDEWASLTSGGKRPRGNYAKFVCEECGETKWILESEKCQGQ